MRRRYFLLPSFCFRPLEALAEAGHCDSESVSVDWPTATEAGRVEKLAPVATQLDAALIVSTASGGSGIKWPVFFVRSLGMSHAARSRLSRFSNSDLRAAATSLARAAVSSARRSARP